MTIPSTSFPSSSGGISTANLSISDGISAANHNFKQIQVVPSSIDFLDIVLSKTQRKTPTVVHKGYQISRIRNFYMRKVKFTQATFDEKLQQILTDFPKIEEVHPFYADLMNVLYDRDHYKLALGQLSTAKHLIDQIGKEYLKLLKFGDSLYRCKQLKRAALGRMATLMKRQKDALSYLEQVRQHLARLPSIDPSTRTLLVCGYPNVGKSSFMNKVSHAHVDVQPYAFTTKSLFVGHFDYEYLRWQVIDTPGILDHPLDERNTIEMQSITALAHIRACVLFFIDVSERCGYTLHDQLSLFVSLKPLFRGKPVAMVANKSDIMKLAELPPASMLMIQEALSGFDMPVSLFESSTMTEEGVMNVRNTACDLLLNMRVEQKRTQKRDILSRLHVAMPVTRDAIPRLPMVPMGVLSGEDSCLSSTSVMEKGPLLREVEAANGGPGVYSYPHSFHHLLGDWKNKIIPEIIDGKNISDFIDPDIEAMLEALEQEELNLEKSPNQTDTGRVLMMRKRGRETMFARTLTRLHARTALRPMRKVSGCDNGSRSRVKKDFTGRFSKNDLSERSQSRVGVRTMKGFSSMAEKSRAKEMNSLAQRPRRGMAGDSDRHATASIPKHLFSGKRKNGTHDRR